MKRSELKRTAQLKRTPFKVKLQPHNRKEPSPKRKALKSKGPRMTPIRRAARGEDCTMRIPGVCNFDPETTVLCHSNQLSDGKGMGKKAPDQAACFGCAACHDLLDGRRPMPDWMTRDQLLAVFAAAVVCTHMILRRKGVMK